MSDSRGNPIVSIITLTFNNADKVIVALDSLRKQTFRDYEHIIIDDASSDNSVEMIEQWIAKNSHACKFIKHSVNKGICKSVNEFLLHARGKYWAAVNDDLWDPHHLEYNIQLLAEPRFKDIRLVYSISEVVDSSLTRIAMWTPEERLISYGADAAFVARLFPNAEGHVVIRGADFIKGLFYCNFFNPVSAIFHVEVSRTLGYDETLEFEDWDFAFRYSEKYDTLYTRNQTTRYVKHNKNFTTSNTIKLNFGKLRTLWKHKSKATDPELYSIVQANISRSALDIIKESRSHSLRVYVSNYLKLVRLTGSLMHVKTFVWYLVQKIRNQVK